MHLPRVQYVEVVTLAFDLLTIQSFGMPYFVYAVVAYHLL